MYYVYQQQKNLVCKSYNGHQAHTHYYVRGKLIFAESKEIIFKLESLGQIKNDKLPKQATNHHHHQ